MKKITVKRKIYKLRMFAFSMFLVSLFAVTIIKPIFIQVQQTYYTVQIQQYERSIAAMRHENEALTIDIQQLSQYARIVAIARESGYERTHTNIITVGKKD
ncbi:MAG: hypothetical protein KGZ51_03840 [Erysipelothrix sp.]|jgi:cell division protein FtsL|nr:hypothetical protein [Erysipelothrix sp.]